MEASDGVVRCVVDTLIKVIEALDLMFSAHDTVGFLMKFVGESVVAVAQNRPASSLDISTASFEITLVQLYLLDI